MLTDDPDDYRISSQCRQWQQNINGW